jgi:hypothetical protein
MLRASELRRRPVHLAALVIATATFAACFIVRRTTIEPVPGLGSTDSVRVWSPVKAHLLDGSTVQFPAGVYVARGVVRGDGLRFGLTLQQAGTVSSLPLDSILGMETYRSTVDGAATVGISLLATAGTIGLGIGIACAMDPKCFGSCPTFYSDSAGTFRLEAEGFSYSIAPLFEARDVDRLRAATSLDGTLRLEVRNEAYETHYLNHLELLEVSHALDEFVVPDASGRPLAVRRLRPATRAIDRVGHDLQATLAQADGQVTRTDDALLGRTTENDLEDHIDLTLPVPDGVDSMALVLRLRNSLLNTVLLYDVMLGDRGARALDWQGQTIQQPLPALALGRWYADAMGLRILVLDGDTMREIAHLRDTGPVAWKDLGVMLAVPRNDSLRLRLSFIADNWRIDRVALGMARHAPFQAYPLADVIGADDRRDTTALASLQSADARYLQTSPTQRFTAVWRPAPLAAGQARTFFLASQGYYIEWMRRSWLAFPRDTLPFTPDRRALAGTLARYRTEKESLEVKFARTRVPVR